MLKCLLKTDTEALNEMQLYGVVLQVKTKPRQSLIEKVVEPVANFNRLV